jgi:hypothetical protein
MARIGCVRSASDEPEECDEVAVSFVLLDDFERVERQAGGSDGVPCGVSADAAEEHGHAEPVGADLVAGRRRCARNQ